MPPVCRLDNGGIIRERNQRFSDSEMLDKLKALHERRGWLSGILIDEDDNMPSSSAYAYKRGYRCIAPSLNLPLGENF